MKAKIRFLDKHLRLWIFVATTSFGDRERFVSLWVFNSVFLSLAPKIFGLSSFEADVSVGDIAKSCGEKLKRLKENDLALINKTLRQARINL